MRWFGWFRKRPAPPAPAIVPVPPPSPQDAPNVFGEIVLPEASLRWKVDGDRTSSNYQFGEDVRIWAYHGDKTAKLYVDRIILLESDKRLYAFTETIQELVGLRHVAREKQCKLRALALLEGVTAKSKT